MRPPEPPRVVRGLNAQATDPFATTVLKPWWWEAAPVESPSDHGLPSRTDVLVIGSGYTGLNAAIELARAGRSVVVVDSEALGYGASTRNGGQVGSGNQRFTVAELTRRHGEQRAQALLREGVAALEHTARLIESEGIECGFRRCGRVRAARKPRHYDALARDMEDLRRAADVESYMVERSEQHREIGSDSYHGIAVLPGDACLHPALYHRGLVQLAQAAGVTLISHTRVGRLVEERGSVRLRTSRGRLEAREVIVATNGYTSSSFRWHLHRVVPINSAIIATEPVDPEVMAEIMPTQRVIGETGRVYHYYRACPHGERMLFGGRAGDDISAGPAAVAHLYADMVRLFPQLDGVNVTHAWTGYVAYTRHGLPHAGRRGPIHHAMGYCGSGVARATYLGYKVARRVLGEDDGHTAWEDARLRRFWLHSLHTVGVPMITSWKRLLDRIS